MQSAAPVASGVRNAVILRLARGSQDGQEHEASGRGVFQDAPGSVGGAGAGVGDAEESGSEQADRFRRTPKAQKEEGRPVVRAPLPGGVSRGRTSINARS